MVLMNAPVYENRFNLTTIVAAVNLALLLVGGGAIYATIKADLRVAQDAAIRQNGEISDIRVSVASNEARIRALELGAGRTEEKLNNILEGLTRIERQLEVRP
jgi:hypothetical protein